MKGGSLFSSGLINRTYEGWWEKWSINFVDFLGPAGVLIMGSMFMSVARKQFKIVTRLSQVRMTPTDPASNQASRTVVRLVHGRHHYHMSILPKYRDIDPQNVRVFSLPDEASEYLLERRVELTDSPTGYRLARPEAIPELLAVAWR